MTALLQLLGLALCIFALCTIVASRLYWAGFEKGLNAMGRFNHDRIIAQGRERDWRGHSSS